MTAIIRPRTVASVVRSAQVRVRYGLNLPTGGAAGDARTLGEFAALAEAAGWDGVFLEDYLVYQDRQDIPTYDPWVALAVMATRTQRLRLGTEVTPLARRRPWKVARETVTLDHLSGGRLVLGVGLGVASAIDMAHFGEQTDNRRRADQLDEALEVLVGLWSGEPFSYAGAHYAIRETTFLPRPVQQPRIPIWVGGGYPNRGPMRRAARWDGACLYRAESPGSSVDVGSLPPDNIRALKRFVERERRASTEFDIVVGGRKRGEDWERERDTIRAVADAGATWWIEWIPPGDPDAMRMAIERGPIRID
ncbi:MAG: LLM class flavin-dependent oxidoreductase [Chloroflexi bacterium]|nr:MAG: LLM class flavin-dependent oxidoreductase [Chloroflexota bacterium]